MFIPLDLIGINRSPISGVGGVPIAHKLATKYLNDCFISVVKGSSSYSRFITRYEQKDHGKVRINVTLYIPESDFKLIRKGLILIWWIHHGMENEYKVDSKDLFYPRIFFDKYFSILDEIGELIAKKIKQIIDMNKKIKVVIHDPYQMTAVAIKTKKLATNYLIGFSQINFPKPEYFLFLNQTGFSKKNIIFFAKRYLHYWFALDEIQFHKQSDVDNFLSCARHFHIHKKLPRLTINPIAVDLIELRKTISSIDSRDITRANNLIKKFSKGRINLNSFKNKILFSSLGIRADPIKRIPLKFRSLDMLLEDKPELVGKLILVQHLLPHRLLESVAYKQNYLLSKKLAQKINAKYKEMTILLIDPLENIPHDEIIKLHNIISSFSMDYFGISTSVEGMSQSSQEVTLAASPDTSFSIISNEDGTGYTYQQYNLDECVIHLEGCDSDEKRVNEIKNKILSTVGLKSSYKRKIRQKVISLHNKIINMDNWSRKLIDNSIKN